MNDARTFRIALLLLAIYLAGLGTGWWLAPRDALSPQRRVVSNNQSGFSFKPGSAEMEAAVMKEMDLRLKLSSGQREKIQELVSRWSLEVRQMPRPLPRFRFESMERWTSAIRTNLTPEQLPAFDEMVETSRARANATRPVK